MDEFFLEQYYKQEERDRDSMPYYENSESNMVDEMIKDFNEDMSGDLNDTEEP